MTLFCWIIVLGLLCNASAIRDHMNDKRYHPKLPTPAVPLFAPQQNSWNYWTEQAQERLREQIHRKQNTNIAKNVILFLGDGMSIPTITAGRIHVAGEKGHLSFDKFPYTGFSKTYCVDRQVSDSACTATAYLGGVKGNYHTLGVTGAVKIDDCEKMNLEEHHSHSVSTWFQAKKKRTGFVTTTRVTHASPAGLYAHVANRYWENDAEVIASNKDPKKCHDIGYQLVHTMAGRRLNVIMGGGRGNLIPSDEVDEDNEEGWRTDKQNMINKWKADKENTNAKYIWNREQLMNINGSVDYLLGLFHTDHIPYNMDRNKTKEPSLEEMVGEAIKILRKEPAGFFLFVEGGRIDTAHHDSEARKAIDEMAEFNKAIQRAVDMTDEEDTLIVVTADHAHTMSVSGYPERGRDVLGLSGWKDTEDYHYFTIGYSNGPGYRKPNPDGSRQDISKEEYMENNFKYPAMYPLDAETHGGDDVGIYARGPWSHLFSGVLEQNTIPHFIAFAACVGDGLTACQLSSETGFNAEQSVPTDSSTTSST